MSAKEMVQIPREVLEKIEWWGDDGVDYCIICFAGRKEGHKEDCPIGIALKQAVEPVQHKKEFKGKKYVTKLGIGGGKVPSCAGCCFCSSILGNCKTCFEEVSSHSLSHSLCCASNNHDKLNRIWVEE